MAETIKTFQNKGLANFTLEIEEKIYNEALNMYNKARYAHVDYEQQPKVEELIQEFEKILMNDIDFEIDENEEKASNIEIGYTDSDNGINRFLRVEFSTKKISGNSFIVTITSVGSFVEPAFK